VKVFKLAKIVMNYALQSVNSQNVRNGLGNFTAVRRQRKHAPNPYDGNVTAANAPLPTACESRAALARIAPLEPEGLSRLNKTHGES
jgi:hypothetical protein